MKQLKLISLCLIIMFLTACSMRHYPVLRKASIDEDYYGISLHIPLAISDTGYAKEEIFLMNTGLSFEFTKKLSSRSNIGTILYPSFIGFGVQTNYKYKLDTHGNVEVAINPNIDLNLSMVPGAYLGLNIIANNNNTDNQFYGGVNVFSGIGGYPSGGYYHIKGLQPFLGFVEVADIANNYYEYFYLKYLPHSEEWVKQGFAYKHTRKK